MHKLYLGLLPLLAIVGTSNAAAQDVWAYVVVGQDNRPAVSLRSPVDLTYPAPGAAVPMAGQTGNAAAHEIRLAPKEAEIRLRQPKVMIMLLPMQQAINIGRMPAQSAANSRAMGGLY